MLWNLVLSYLTDGEDLEDRGGDLVCKVISESSWIMRLKMNLLWCKLFRNSYIAIYNLHFLEFSQNPMV